ncbi:Hint domain-containing protein, partial [Nioella ostreopsis]|uniref:Hint domain-containing protein n=1 Tax=Nioella ostreopsis TaxID=2448479 RepID=UPI0013DFCF92
MPDQVYATQGYVLLTGVNHTGSGDGTAGSTITWTGTNPADSNFNVTDVNADGNLADGTDYFISSSYLFTGYTIEGSDGNFYGIFQNGTFFYVPLPVDGTAQTLIASSGASNAYNSPEGNAYLCFTAGTQITTPTGDTCVEALQIGDLLCTKEGTHVPVKWIGRQTVSTGFGPAERLMPVRFAAGSLGDGLPTDDLTVTADHGMLVSGVICHAGALVNGTTITRVPLAEMGATYMVYHVETEEHEIILANGAP